MAIEVHRPSEKPMRNTSYLNTKLETAAAESKESKAKWAKDHPLREPGTSLYTYKSFSRQRYPSERYAQKYQEIDWSR